MVGEYMSTYGFVGHLKLEEVADKVLGENWEAEDDVNQIQLICDHIEKGKYSVYFQEGIRHEHDIIVREVDNFKELKWANTSLAIALSINESNLKKMDWQDQFIDYIYATRPKVYNEACEFIDKNDELTENGLDVEAVKEYYLNSGFPKYNEEPFASEYSDSDWIDYANENDLKR